MALLPAPQKSGLSDEEIRELIGKIASAEIVCSHGEAVNDYFLNLLELTGLTETRTFSIFHLRNGKNQEL